MKKFLVWITLTSLFLVLYGAFEYQFQFFTGMAETDPYMICKILWGLMAFVVFESFFVSITKMKAESLSVLAFLGTLTGLLGTFLGLGGSLEAMDIANLDISNQEMVKQSLADTNYYMFVAMNTSITGILVAIPATLYMYFLKDNKNEVS